MTAIDNLVLGGLILVFLGIGLFGSKPAQSSEDYFLAGRGLRWYQIGFSLFATNFSASALIGITGAAYATGVAIYNYEWTGAVALVLFALFFVGVVRGSGVMTITEYLQRRFDSRVKTVYSVLIIFLVVFVDMSTSLYAGGLLISAFIPALEPRTVMLAAMLLAGLYSVVGGMRAISRTDMVQSIILCTGAFSIAFFSLRAIGGFEGLAQFHTGELMHLVRSADDRAVPWTGMLLGLPILSAYFWMLNQNMVQWSLAAKNVNEARKGLVLAALLKLPVIFMIVMPGVIATKLVPGLEAADEVYPHLLIELLPAGLLGLVLAGFVAALMSNTDSTLHAASTIITMDFVHRWRTNLSPSQLMWIGRGTTFVIILLAAAWAPMIQHFGTLFEYIQSLLSFAVTPFVVVYIGGMFWPRATSKGAFWALLAGFTLSFVLFLSVNIFQVLQVHYLNLPLPIGLFTLAVFVAISLMTPEQQVDEALIWTVQRAGVLSKHKGPVLITLLILFSIALSVILFLYF